MDQFDQIFALDIGTRSVIGIILKKENEKYHIVEMLTKEHNERSMLDGQIHDVLSVSKIISQLKEELEQKHGELKKVCVAAAGRALKTRRGQIKIPIAQKPIINNDDILHLQLSAVQQAQISLATENQDESTTNYYCVGYSVVRYQLDGDEIVSLIDQKGEEASVEVIATFLPKVVVESLLAALERADLEMHALTLEPIAAINVLIPPSMRRLNVALVDIGAGTSDIAITDMGTVVAYGMVPIAGDEITEAVSDAYLLDFPLAEKAKRELNTQDEITVYDILGFETTVPRQEVIEKISDSLERLADSIANEILALNNNQAPKAIMLIGGGSLTPELPKLLSKKLELPENRIAIRGIDAIQKLELAEHIELRPELVTPIGIAIAASLSPIQYITVYVNDRPIRLFDMKKLTVGDCLLASGIEMNKLYGKPGMAIFITLNGREISVPGDHGGPPTLLKNNEITSLDSLIKNGDRLTVQKGLDGKSPELKLSDLIEDHIEKQVWINEVPYQIKMEILKNGQKVNDSIELEDKDVIETIYPKTIYELFNALNHAEGLKSLEPFYVYLNRAKVSFLEHSPLLFKNSLEVKPNATIEDGDKIVIKKKETPTVQDLLDRKNLSLYYQIPIIFNGKQITLKKSALDMFKNEKRVSEDDELQLGDNIQYINKKVDPFIFQDLFRHVDINLPNAQSGNFILLKNGQETTFHDNLAPGDELQILWPSKINN